MTNRYIKFLFVYFAFLLVYLSSVNAESIRGYDVLGLAKSDAKMLAATIEPNTALGSLEGTFGEVIPKQELLLKTGKIVAFRTHLTNGTCARNNNCERGEPKANDLRALKKRAVAFEALHQRYPNITCYLSPRLEHDEKSHTLVDSWYKILSEYAPSCRKVCSAFRGYCPSDPSILIEKHGNQNQADIVSNDGESLFDADTSKYWGHGSTISFGWIHRFNLRVTGEKTFTPPSKRTHEVSKADVMQVSELMKPVATVPSPPGACRKLIKIVPPEILKSNAEDYGNGAARDNKPVLLIKRKYNNGFGVLSPSGKKIACLSNRNNLPPFNGLNRYYLGECENKSNVAVLKLSGSEWVFYKNGSTCYLGNAIRRLGDYR